MAQLTKHVTIHIIFYNKTKIVRFLIVSQHVAVVACDENPSAGGTVKKWAISLIFLQNYKHSKQRDNLLGYSLEVTASYGRD